MLGFFFCVLFLAGFDSASAGAVAFSADTGFVAGFDVRDLPAQPGNTHIFI
jgi:hypothetical protein